MKAIKKKRKRKGDFMEKWYTESVEKLIEALLSLKTPDECRCFLEDVCTVKEIQEISQRFLVAEMLFDKKIYNDIARETGASTATISRVNRCLTYGSGGYEMVLERIKKESKE